MPSVPQSARVFLAAGALSAALAVVLGALGAHGLKSRLAPDMLAVYQTAVQYQFWHALGMLCVGLACLVVIESRWLKASGLLFAAGTLAFSGSLYAIALTGTTGLGLFAPIGGAAFILGWVALCVAALTA